MSFRFRLENILRLRASLEHREELLLQAANQKLAQIRNEIEACARQMQDRTLVQRSRMNDGEFASELHFELSVANSMQTRLQALHSDLKHLEAVRDQQRTRYQKARRDRETLEAIRTQELDAHRVEEQRRTQRAMDDLFLLRREFLRRG
jgi:flagellar export protein FliJ